MEYRKLEKEFNKKGFHFKEVWREGDYCIYSMSNDLKILSYESFKTHVTPEYLMAGVKIEAKEWFPSWAEVGIKMAHSCASLGFAHKRIEEYKQKSESAPQIKQEYLIPPNLFTTNDLATLNNTNYVSSFNWIKENLNKKIVFVEAKNMNGGRGKPSKFFKKL